MASGAATGSRANADAAAAFSQGDRVYLRPVAHSWLAEAFTVIGPVSRGGWPHYDLRAPDGSTWIASQLELSASPLWDGSEHSRPRRLRRSKAVAKAAQETAAAEHPTSDPVS